MTRGTITPFEHPDTLLQRARDIFLHRRKRVAIFGPAFFGEPAWEMLLVLYVSQRTHRSTTTKIARLSQTPMTTALRWMEALEREDLVERQRHPTDGRMTFIA